jgi:RNA polymerase sigma-70 factor (ECF subfamily)
MVACGSGDLDGLLGLLADDVVVWTDGGGKVRAAMRPVVGAYRSSRFLLNVAKKVHGVPRAVTLNGQPALVFFDDIDVVTALVLDVSEGKIVGVRTVSNPDKLARLSRELIPDRRQVDDASGPDDEAGPLSRGASGYEPDPAPRHLR